MRTMTKNEAVKLAGSQSNLARIFGITPQAVIQWPEGPLPDARLYELRGRRPEWFTGPTCPPPAYDEAPTLSA